MFIGNVDDDEDAVSIVGNGGLSIRFLVKFAKFWGDFGRAEHKLDPSRVESIDKWSIFGLTTTTNR